MELQTRNQKNNQKNIRILKPTTVMSPETILKAMEHRAKQDEGLSFDADTSSYVLGQWMLDNHLISEKIHEVRTKQWIQEDLRFMDNLIQKLKKKNIYTLDGQKVLRRISDASEMAVPRLMLVFDAHGVETFHPVAFPKITLKKDDWYAAITHMCILRDSTHPEISYLEFIKTELIWMYTLVMLYHMLDEYRQNKTPEPVQTGPSAQEYNELKRKLNKAENEVEELKSEVSRKTTFIGTQQQEIEQQRAKIAKLERQLAYIDKDQNNRLREELDSLRKENAALKKQAAAKSQQKQQKQQKQNRDAEAEKKMLESVVLPESNVVFLGGHTNMVKKVKAIYPKWFYVSDETFSTRPAPSNPEVVFFWTDHTSHGMMWKTYNEVADGTPIVYLSATNIELLQQQMKKGYLELQTQKPADEK